jgi:lipoate-protein ligase A
LAHQTWRWIDSGEGEASWNLAVDEAILDAVTDGISGPTIRLYRWDAPTISVGRFQEVNRGVDLEACERLNVSVVRRITGGRGVLHGTDQTISIVVPVTLLGDNGKRIVDSYKALSEGFTVALNLLRLQTNLGSAERRSEKSGDCFAARSEADILTSSGEKLIGSAQCRRNGVLLQQSSFRHRRPDITPEDLFLGRTGEGTYPANQIEEDQLAKALHDSFESVLEIALEPGILDEWEYERAGAIMGSYAPLTLVDSRPSL